MQTKRQENVEGDPEGFMWKHWQKQSKQRAKWTLGDQTLQCAGSETGSSLLSCSTRGEQLGVKVVFTVDCI